MFFCLLTAFVLSPAKPILVIGGPTPTELDNRTTFLFSRDGKRLYLTGQVGLIKAFDPGTGKELLGIRTGERTVGAMALNRQGTRLASIHGDRVKVWDTATGTEITSFVAWPGNFIPCLAFDRAGECLACPSAVDTVTVWELSTCRPVRSFRRQIKSDNIRDCICNLAYSPDGKSLAAADSATEFVTVWSTASRKVQFTLHVKDPGQTWDFGIADCKVAFSPNGRWIATAGCEYDDVKLWHAADGKQIYAFRGGKAMAFTPDSRYVATLASTWMEAKIPKVGEKPTPRWTEAGGEIRVWDLANGKEIFAMKPPGTSPVSEMAFHPGGKRLATMHNDGTVDVWDLSGVLPSSSLAASVRPR
jgi:WD40 repeat protein